MIFMGYLISIISLKWDSRDKEKNVNENSDTKVEKIELDQENIENKKD